MFILLSTGNGKPVYFTKIIKCQKFFICIYWQLFGAMHIFVSRQSCKLLRVWYTVHTTLSYMLITRPCLTPLLLIVLVHCDILSSQLGPFTNTCMECPSYPHTLGVALCRYNVVVGSVSSELMREGDDGRSTLGGGGVPVDQVGVGWVHTIVNGAGVPWLNKCALKKGSQQVGDIDKNH